MLMVLRSERKTISRAEYPENDCKKNFENQELWSNAVGLSKKNCKRTRSCVVVLLVRECKERYESCTVKLV